jgi:hypothetical protein
MEDPWNIKKSFDRMEDSLPTFIIFCEDEVSESVYLKFFETSLIKINFIENQKSKTDNVYRAIAYCIERNWMGHNNVLSIDQLNRLQVWCIFDRDVENDKNKRAIGDIDFNESIKTASGKGIKVAWSNDAFELWILLHFEDLDPANQDNGNRVTYYQRLTDIFNSLSDPSDKLKRIISHKTFSYKNDLKQRKNFLEIVRDRIIGNVKVAIERAKVLENHWEQSNAADHAKAPCTLVHHLVEELIKAGGKQFNISC